MQPGIVNYADTVRGDTIPELSFTLTETVGMSTSAIDLTGADIKVQFRLRSTVVTKEIGDGVTVTDAEEGQFKIDSFTLTTVGRWSYDVQITFADAEVQTYIAGSINITQDITQ